MNNHDFRGIARCYVREINNITMPLWLIGIDGLDRNNYQEHFEIGTKTSEQENSLKHRTNDDEYRNRMRKKQ